MREDKEDQGDSGGQGKSALNVDDEPVSEAVSKLVSEPAPEPVRTVPMVLLVEDNEDNRDMLSRRLQRSGYEVVIAVDGAEGVSKTATEKPDIVLMDMSLPVIDGWEATQQLKANPQTRSIPIIALTAHAMSGDREKALSAGVMSTTLNLLIYHACWVRSKLFWKKLNPPRKMLIHSPATGNFIS